MPRPSESAFRCIAADRPARREFELQTALYLGAFLLGTTSRGGHVRMILLRPDVVVRRVGQALLVPVLLVLLAGVPLVYLRRDAIQSTVVATYWHAARNSQVSTTAPLPATTKVVIAETLAVHQEPDSTAAVVSILERDEVVVLLNDIVSTDGTVWILVSIGRDQRGWVPATQLR